jgi:hypothetical protein
MRSRLSLTSVLSLVILGALPARVLGEQVLSTSGFSSCLTGSAISVNNVDIEYNNDEKTVTFDVSGTSSASMNVTATLDVTAYGISVYSNSFNPCDTATYVAQLCPGMSSHLS